MHLKKEVIYIKIKNMIILLNCNYMNFDEENDYQYNKNIVILTNSKKKDIAFDINTGKRIYNKKVALEVNTSILEDIFNIEDYINIDSIKSIINYRFVSLKNTFNNNLFDSFIYTEITDNHDNKVYIDLINQKKITCNNLELIKYDFSDEDIVYIKNKHIDYKHINVDLKTRILFNKKVKLYTKKTQTI